MRWTIAALVVGVLGIEAGFAQPASAPATDATQPAQQRVVRMTVHPAAEPVPALKYQLLPPVADQVHGDAMTLYYVAMEKVSLLREKHKDFEDQANEWGETPLADLPKDRVHAMLKEFDEFMPLLDLATRQTSCQWNLGVEQLGYATYLPGLNLWRYMNRFTALRARLAIAEGRYDEAIHSLQMGFGMARHVAAGPTLIQTLVGIAIAAMQTRQLEALIAAKDGPNLYWAIADLPKPLCDLSKGLHFESNCLRYTIPELREAESGKMTPQQWDALPAKITKRFGEFFAGQENIPDIAKGTFPSKVLPEAREYWHSRGLSDKQIDAMPVQEANIVYSLAMYDQLWADVVKWFALPYWQTESGIARAEKRINEANKKRLAGLFIPLLGTIGTLRAHQAICQQDLAALQAIEAIRIYAATHDGKVPATLAEMTDPPAPLSPVTGQPFKYDVKGNHFVLDAPAPEGFDVSRGVRYEITVTAE